MEDNNIKELLTILNNYIDKISTGEDKQKIIYSCNLLRKIQQELPNMTEIDKLKKEINNLEIKYDCFNDLSYYFDPLYIKLKKKIHNQDVKKIRENNKRKIGTN